MAVSRLAIRKTDILDHPAEALIYSTNTELNCSGGVGGALVYRYGTRVQDALDGLREGKPRVPQGSIFELTLPGMPYRAVFHTVPTDRWHQTTAEKVAQVLKQALEACAGRNIESVALSALATGYGDLMLEDFLLLAARIVPDFPSIREITLCLNEPAAYALALRLIESRQLAVGRA